ncbi:hypothetical protein IPA_02715 [Ignicoccus pacificus DSM 13166]|uniref:Uncharacterized protein n=1 Tax=Ignicoccus pacificus DSM 13166 TaxID=940294 RepID=A0A977KAT6_9CREN|nr:hypothetical protein IPA_02715 [Ignicoccus pacificus DSM 13166]
MRRSLTLVLLLALASLSLAWWGRPCPSYGSAPFRGTPMVNPPTAHPYCYPGNCTAVTTQNTPSARPIGDPFCTQCHYTRPVVNYVYTVRQPRTVSGTVIESAPTIAVILNGSTVYHVRFPYYCQVPKAGSNVTLNVFVTMGAKAGNLNWYMGMVQSCS